MRTSTEWCTSTDWYTFPCELEDLERLPDLKLDETAFEVFAGCTDSKKQKPKKKPFDFRERRLRNRAAASRARALRIQYTQALEQFVFGKGVAPQFGPAKLKFMKRWIATQEACE